MAVTLAQLQADDETYASYAKAHPEMPADQPPQDIASAKQDGQPVGQTGPSLLQRFGGYVGHVTTNMIDSTVGELEQWGTAAKRVGQDAAAGTATAVKNTMDFVSSQHPDDPSDPANAPSPLWDHAKSAVMDFRDAVAVKDPNIVDGLAQGAAQLVGPFMAYSKALSGLHGVANMVAAGAVTDATALQPHDMRTADLIALGRQTDTKIGAVLRTLGPYGLNAYVNFLTDRGNESEAEGRFKNALDGLGANLVVSPLIHAAGIVVKQGTAATRYLAENGVRNTIGDMIADPKVGLSAQEGKIVFHGSKAPGIKEFDNGSIGTGVGKQAFGHGLYFTEDPKAASLYRPTGGALYHVEIPDEHIDRMLKWDKPLSEQPKTVQSALSHDDPSISGQHLYEALSEKLGGDKQASEFLSNQGVPGIDYSASGKYSQGGSPARNTVLFDAKHAKIVKKE